MNVYRSSGAHTRERCEKQKQSLAHSVLAVFLQRNLDHHHVMDGVSTYLALTFGTLLSSQGTDASFVLTLSGFPPGASLRCFRLYQILFRPDPRSAGLSFRPLGRSDVSNLSGFSRRFPIGPLVGPKRVDESPSNGIRACRNRPGRGIVLVVWVPQGRPSCCPGTMTTPWQPGEPYGSGKGLSRFPCQDHQSRSLSRPPASGWACSTRRRSLVRTSPSTARSAGVRS